MNGNTPGVLFSFLSPVIYPKEEYIMFKTLKRLASALLIAALISTSVFVTPAEAAGLSTPKNCHFIRWLDFSFSTFRVGWNLVNGANLYIIELAEADGSNPEYYESSKSYATLPLTNTARVHKVRVCACKEDSSGKIVKISNLSNTVFIIPSPTDCSMSMPDRTKLRAKFKWNRVVGANGYNVFLSTNPKGTWYINKQPSTSSATSVTIDKYRGAKLKKYTNYYIKIVSRRVLNGRYITVPTPTNYYTYWFKFYNAY